ncbi:MAG: hypothetical protein IJN47_06980 [Clostridia bacterium]|nr:hypothetical protein [Clostridia bacterium]
MQLRILADEASYEEVESKTLDRLDRATETAHYIFRCAAGSLAEGEIGAIAAEQEQAYGKLKTLFGYKLPEKIEYLLTASPEENGAVLGELFGGEGAYPINGFSIAPKYVFAAYDDQVKCVGCHEVTHLFSYALCMPKSQFLSEGLAMYTDGAFWGKPNDRWVKEFLERGVYIPLAQLLSDEGFYAHPSEITYPIAGAFVAFLIEKLGAKRFLQEVYPSDMPLLENLGRCLDIHKDQIEAAFQAAVLAGETP